MRILIVGAGKAGSTLLESLIKLGEGEVVGFLDDEIKSDISGFPVIGQLDEINDVIKRYKITEIYYAIPSAPASVMRNFINSIDSLEGIRISVVPRSFKTLIKDFIGKEDMVNEIDISEIIGREHVKQDFIEAKSKLKGKKVMVTGAAGSIGSELVRQLKLLEVDKIICFDWWENGMFYLQQELNENKGGMEYVIGSVQNKARLESAIKRYSPDILFHAAAFKHVPLMQHNPLEAFNNNVYGTLNVIESAINCGLEGCVIISTDKAVNPVNVMGSTKRMCEMLMEVHSEKQKETKFSAVRFGNVIASNGSVIPLFKKQIAQGGPVTVTHEEVTRYFMTIEEAAQLVIQSWTLGRHGEIFTLDMGEPLKIYDLAKALIKLSGKKVEIQVVGLRPGEKLHEELHYSEDDVEKTKHPKIFITKKEKEFDHNEFLSKVKEFIPRTLNYEVEPKEVKEFLKSLGFKLKD